MEFFDIKNEMIYDFSDFCFTIAVKEMKYRTWKFVINKCLAWRGTQYDPAFKDFVYEDKGKFAKLKNKIIHSSKIIEFPNLDPDLQVLTSVPGTVYLISSIILLMITKHLQNSS